MDSSAIVTAVVIAATMAVLVVDRYRVAVVLGGAVAALLFVGIIDTDVALSGLSARAPATVAALYVVAGAVTATGLLGPVVDRIMSPRGGSVWSLASGVATLSTVMPNTPLVAMLAPRVVEWSRRHGRRAALFLMPLSFASMLGGVVTVIGTSTNLVVSDLLRAAGEEPLGLFEITPVGLPVAAAGVVVLGVVAPRVLRGRGSVDAADELNGARSFHAAATVDGHGPLVGRTIEAAGLRDLEGAYLAVIERRVGAVVRSVPAAPHTALRAGDVCCFVGDLRRVLDLDAIPGLTARARPVQLSTEGPGTGLFEAVIGPGSALLGTTLRSIGFRERYGGAVLAIHRADGEIGGQLGRVPLRTGDVLVVLARDDFAERWRGTSDFSLVAAAHEPAPPRRHRWWVVPIVVVAMLAVAAFGAMSLFEAALAAAIALVAGGVISFREAVRAIDVDVVVTMAIAISLGGAVAASGLADGIAGFVGGRFDAGSPDWVVIATLLVATVLMTELLTNTAAAALMVPIALSVAADTAIDPRATAIAVLIGASCSFLSPIGYQTNLMVYGLGGYRFTDFARLGFPLVVMTSVVAIAALVLVI